MEIPLSSWRLLVPPVRLISAVMWKVVHLRNTEHYGKVEEFVSLVTKAIPDILSDTQKQLLKLGLRAKKMFPEEFGHDFDTSLETLVSKLIQKLEDQLLVPNFKQTAAGLSDVSSVLEEYMQCVSKAEDLEVLLRSKARFSDTTNGDSDEPLPSEQQLLSSLCRSDSLNPKDEEMKFFDQTDSEIEVTTEPYVIVLDVDSCSISDVAGRNHNEGSREVPVEEELCDQATVALQDPPTSAETSVTSSSVSAPQKKRIAHKCSHCGKCFIYRHELLEHQRLHTGEHPYKCSECGKTFRRSTDLSTHRRKHCTEAAYICIKCQKSFQSVQERFGHLCDSVQKFSCSQCGERFKKRNLLMKHELTHRHDQVFTCRQCEAFFPSLTELRIHQKDHPSDSSYQCKQCGKFYRSISSLKIHERRHKRPRTQICTICSKAFKRKIDLNVHMRTHTGEKPFQCSYCGKSFTMSCNLTVHIRIHTGEKPYVCSNCGKAFVSGGDLQMHRRIHTGDKPHICSVCGKGYAMPSKLATHMRVHTGEKPYLCSVCGKGFSLNTELKKHMMNHTGIRPFACQMCAKTYMRHNHLKRHMKTHSAVQTEEV